MDSMDKKIQSHKECSYHRYRWDFETGADDESEPWCSNPYMKELVLFKRVPLCGRGDPVKLDTAEYCAACEFFPEQHKQKALLS